MSAQRLNLKNLSTLHATRLNSAAFNFSLDQNGATLTSGGRLISLSTAESTILRALLERSGEFRDH